MPIFLPLIFLVYQVLSVFPLCRLLSNAENMGMDFDFLVSRNNILILQMTTPWDQDHVPLSIYTDIFRCLGSHNIFSHACVSFDLPQYSFSKPPDRQKYSDFGPTLRPTTARYTRTFSTIWVSIDFYFSRREQRK